MANASTRRVPGLDLMKLLGAYLVILYHLTFRAAPEVLPGGVGPAAVYFLYTLLTICVPLFLTASGALSLTRPVPVRRNLARAAHLLVLILFWTPFSLAFVLLLRRQSVTPGEFYGYMANLAQGLIQHLWYLPTFLFLTLMLPVFRALRTRARSVWRYGLALLALFTFGNLLLSNLEYLLRWLLGRTGYSGYRQYFWYTNYFAYHYWWSAVYLALGAFLMEHREVLGKRRKAAVVMILLGMAALTLVGYARSRVRGSTYDPVFNSYGDPAGLLMTCGAGMLLIGLTPKGRLAWAVERIARCSLGIYLVHWLLVEILIDFLPGVMNAVAVSPLTAVLVLALSWGITEGMMKVPVVGNLFTATPAWIKNVAPGEPV